MKLPELPINLGKVSDWQRGVFLALLASLVIFILGLAFLLVKPLGKDLVTIIDEEISQTNVIFDQKTLDMLRTRQNPSLVPSSSSGKNPFAPF